MLRAEYKPFVARIMKSCSWCHKHRKTDFVFDRYISVCSITFGDMASKTRPFEEANKGSCFTVCFVRSERKALGTWEEILCQACSSALTQSSLPLSLSLSLFFLTRAETSKRTVPWCASNKSSLLNFILFWICVWITLELQIKICWTLRVRSCGIDHSGSQRSLLV